MAARSRSWVTVTLLCCAATCAKDDSLRPKASTNTQRVFRSKTYPSHVTAPVTP